MMSKISKKSVSTVTYPRKSPNNLYPGERILRGASQESLYEVPPTPKNYQPNISLMVQPRLSAEKSIGEQTKEKRIER